ncbi:hypothetical protein BCV70DRAFT_185776 [Testicularia cyperi]|uniref:Postreplication repair E3 ubiquitin-protein ligase RAD18 n=1 Tax=Testicularia cyperi TaxID=1882483 RepID=A0A317XXH4_9BASI|nr:hypothetical protein BCV70DRAFT_185776 [Testicularia cyperi]
MHGLSALMDEVTDPSDWHHDFTVLKELDSSLRCDLCFDIYTSPVSIKTCHHTFCSSCIRTHINQSGNSGSFCPKCRQSKAYDSELVPQPVLEVTALEWKKARRFLARLQQRPQNGSGSVESSSKAQSRAVAPGKRSTAEGESSTRDSSRIQEQQPRRSKRIRIEASGSRSSPVTLDEDEEDGERVITEPTAGKHGQSSGNGHSNGTAPSEDPRHGDYEQEESVGAPASRRKSSEASSRQTETSNHGQERELRPSDTVTCPICGHEFTVSALNRHLDTANCYPGFPAPTAEQRGFGTPSGPVASSHSKSRLSWFTSTNPTSASGSGSTAASGSGPIPEHPLILANERRLVRPQYSLKSDRELRKLLDDAGLPTTGDRERMMERHRQWINIWNANLDSTRARRTASQLRKELADWERHRAGTRDHAATVERQRTTWTTNNRAQFDDLVQKARMGAARDRKLREQKQSNEAAEGTPTAPDSPTMSVSVRDSVEDGPSTNDEPDADVRRAENST